MSQDFGFKKESFFNKIPDLYPSPKKQAQSAMEEPSKDEQKSKSVRLFDSLDDRSSSPEGTSTRPAKASPPGQPDTTSSTSSSSSKIPITITFHYSESDPGEQAIGDLINDWRPLQRMVEPLASETEFSEILRSALNGTKTTESPLIDQLQKSGMELHLRPSIAFGDWRDGYLRPDVCGVFNFEQVDNLFFRPCDDISVNVVVDVTLHPLDTEADTFLKPNRDIYIPFSYDVRPNNDNRNAKPPGIGIDLEPISRMHLARCPNGSTQSIELLAVASRRIDGHLFGDLRLSTPLYDFPNPRTTFASFNQPTRPELEEEIKSFVGRLGTDPTASLDSLTEMFLLRQS